ncbi:hypothetical protein [Paenibacillus sp. FSL R7-0273]|uniref:hypothetical protein n=1 Tax=Paenibacillus sp. FSL R7-0273 TaxID=1536772 RepID=UPI0006945BFB|nr:hypothetical protein [Paenibacillus sp. FSL R7-0273]
MRIVLVNGSPKGGASNSGILLEKLKPLITDGNELSMYRVNVKPLKPEQYRELNEADVLVLAFPLYFDAIPSHLLRMMVELEKFRGLEPGNPGLTVYALINNGFYEGHQCKIAADIVRNWCSRSGFRFGMAVGHGAGEMFKSLSQVPLGKGPLKNLGKAMHQLSAAIYTRSSADSLFIQPNFPRIAWRLAATHSFWHARAKKNGLRPKDLRRQPSQENR